MTRQLCCGMCKNLQWSHAKELRLSYKLFFLFQLNIIVFWNLNCEWNFLSKVGHWGDWITQSQPLHNWVFFIKISFRSPIRPYGRYHQISNISHNLVGNKIVDHSDVGVRTNFNEMLTKIHIFSFKKMPLIMSSAKWRPFCLGLNVSPKDGQVVSFIVTTCWRLSCAQHLTQGAQTKMANIS